MRATGGTWIAHGSGSADRKVVDPDGRILVPPDDPRYALRRVWLTEEEERGYYYGFANETLWPLCHVVYVRPTFRSRDWAHYQAVNAHFCRAVAEEAPTKATVWVHDYHLALLPAMLKAARPDLTVAHFWHIPWLVVRRCSASALAERNPGGTPRQRRAGLPHPLPLRQFSRRGEPGARGEYRPRALGGHLRGHTTLVRALPHQRGCRGHRSRGPVRGGGAGDGPAARAVRAGG